MAEKEDIIVAEERIANLAQEMEKFKAARTAFENTTKTVSSATDECIKKIGSFHQNTADKLQGFLEEIKNISSDFLSRTEEIKDKAEQSIKEMANFTNEFRKLSGDLIEEMKQINSQSFEVTNQEIQKIGGELKKDIGNSRDILDFLEGKIRTSFWISVVGIPIMFFFLLILFFRCCGR